MTGEKTRNILDIGLPLAAILEAVVTAKASRGNYVGQTGMDLIKARSEQQRYNDQQREKALERAAQAGERKSDREFKEKDFKLRQTESTSKMGRDEAEFRSKEDAVHRALVDKDALSEGLLGPQYDDKATNTINLRGIGLPDLTPRDRAKIKADPQKFLFEKEERDPLADFAAKLKIKMDNPMPKPGGGAPKPPNPRLLPAGTVEDLAGVQEAVAMLDKMAKSSVKLKHDLGPLNKVRTLNPMDTEIHALQQYIATTKQVIGKGLEGGVLRKEDEFKYEKIIPKISDTPEVRTQKKVQLRDMLVNKYKTQVKAQGDAGYSTGNLPSEINPEKGPELESYPPAIEALRVKAVNGDKEAARYLDSKGIVY